MEDAAKLPSPARRAQSERLRRDVALNASTVFLFAIAGMVNYLAFRHYERFDWTSQGVFTLSPKSKSVARELSKDIDIYVFLSQGEESYASTDELLNRYAAASPHIKVHHVDPDRQASEFKLLAQRFGIAAGVIETGEARADVAAVVAHGDKNWHIGREDLVSMDFGAPGETEHESVSLKAEQAVTGALVQVTAGRATKLCVTQGHGEWSLEDASERSLSGFKAGLHRDNIEWEAFETLGKTAVPKECDAVFVLGPLRAFSEREAKLLIDYTKGGGNVLLALDPVIEHDEVSATGFEGPLRELGVRLDRSLVLELDKDRLLSPNVAEFAVTEFGDHPTTRPLQHAARVFMVLARSVTPSGEDPNAHVEVLLRTSDQGYAETAVADVKQDSEPKRGPGDIEGPVSIAVATQLGKSETDPDSKTGGRLIVVGDSDFLQGPLLETPELANFHLASAWTGWLTERPALIEIPPKKVKTGNIVFTQEDLWALFFRVAVLIPGAAFALGIAVWLNRRA